MNAALGRAGPGAAVERDHDGHGTGPLAVGTFVVGRGMVDEVGPMRVNLRNAGHSAGAQMASGGADRVGRHGVVPGPENGVGYDHGHRDVHPVGRRGPGVPGLVDAEPVEVRDALDARVMLREQVEHGLPQSFGNADLDAHGAPAVPDGPRYAELVSAA